MEDLSFNNAGQPEKPKVKAPEKDSDDDDEEDGSLFRKLFSKSEKADKEAEKPSGIFERFKKRANTELKDESDEADVEAGLTNKEKPLAASSVAEALAEQIPEHTDIEEKTEQVAGDVAAREYLEDVAATGEIEAAATRKMAELELDPAEVATFEAVVEAERPVAGPEPELVVEGEPGTGSVAPEDDEELVFDRSAEAEPDDEDDDIATSTTPPSSPPPVTPPPAPPTSPGGPTPPLGPGLTPPGGPTPIPTLSGNIMNGPITPNSSSAEVYDQGNPAVTALIGGIIGYYIGRRRGRIKTEKRLLPIQKKLEHQVEDLHWEIKRKEIAIRKAAAEKVRREGPYVVERLVAGRAAKQEKTPDKRPEAVKTPILERLTIERRPAPEASQLHGPAKTHEQIGRVLVTAAEKPVPASRQTETINQKAPEKLPTYLTERRVETLNRSELLLMSEKIVIDGSTLRQIYETHLIGERGLRRLMAEHLRGGDIKKILRREILEHEIDFERDPAVRDVPAAPGGIITTATTSAKPIAGKSALDKLVEQASAGFGDGNAQAAAYYKARAAYEAREHQDQKNQRRLVDIGLVTAITLLAIMVAVLYFSHR